MKNSIFSSGLALSAAIVLVGCGGGSDTPVNTTPSTGTSYYIDAAVSGINYKCGSQEGITGEDGSFTFEVGQSCTFYLGDIKLRDVDVSLLHDGEKVHETDVAIARVLQSLDTDGDPDNGITINEEIVEALSEANVSALPTSEEALESFLEVIEEHGGTVVSKEDAKAHLDEVKLKDLLAGKTLYTTIWDDMGTMESWAFNADMTSATWTELVGGNATGTDDITMKGMTITATCTSDSEGECDAMPAILEVKEITDDYLAIDVTGGDMGDEVEHLRVYFEEEKARAYLLNNTPDLQTLLAGKTLYTTIWDDIGTMESWAFNADLTSARWTELVGGDATGTNSLSVNGMTMTAVCTSDSEEECDTTPTLIEIKEVLDDYLVVEVSGGELEDETETLRLYFDEEKARAYLLSNNTANLTTLLAGKTVYAVGETPDGILESITFSTDMTSSTWQEIEGGNDSGTDSISVNGMVITIMPEDPEAGNETLTVTEVNDDYISATYREEDDGEVVSVEERLYFDEAKARTHLGL